MKEKSKTKKWNYRLNEVYLIAAMNFNFPKKEYRPDEYYHRVMLTDLDDNHVFYDKLTLIYLEMPKVGKVKLNMNRPLDRWLRVLYQLWGEEECPPELDEPVFHKLYEQAEYARFTPDHRLTYERSKKRELDIYNQIEGGRILGSEERATQIAQKMLAMGLDRAAIVEATGLSDDDF
jgi:predicted transposase/invertase (TIGR01784 family)